ncbi:MAG: phospholipase D family protein [Xanthobacteraceae bacterium]|nr:phospholipase D family protein [Xanthobacteraceae bacterium]
MRRLFSNGPSKDFVRTAFERLAHTSSQLYLAAPYFSYSEPILKAANLGKPVQLLIGLNSATSPQAISEIIGLPGVFIRYFTHRFHAKLYVFDDAALVGSANLTDAGMMANREGVITFDREEDRDTVEEVRALFAELWNDALVLTPDKLAVFIQTLKELKAGPDPDAAIEKALGRAMPKNINVESRKTSRERLFLEGLRRQVYEEYRPAFSEVQGLLTSHNLHRPELISLGAEHGTNRFLNWVRLTQAPGEDTWKATPLRSPAERRDEILRLGREWIGAKDNRVVPEYADLLANVTRVFQSNDAIMASTKEELSDGLLGLHAFLEQLRFVKGGLPNLVPTFWRENDDDETGVKETISYLLHGTGDFIQRLHDVLYDREWKIAYFGLFCALELYGSIKPHEFPPLNGRMAKALRFIGFQVKGA